MQKSLSILSLVIAIAALLLGVFNHQQKSDAAYVINARIFNEYQGKIEMESKFKDSQQKHQQNLDELAKELTTLQNLVKETPNDINVELTFQQKEREYANILKNYEGSYQEVQQQMTSEIYKQINMAMKDFGVDKGYSFVYGVDGSGAIMFADGSMDVTDEFLTFLNNGYQDAASEQ